MKGAPWGHSVVEPETWERVARLLKEEPGISDAAVSRRLGANRRHVASVRRSLGIAPYRQGRPWTPERLAAMTRTLPGGHLRWEGRIGSGGAPMATGLLTVNRVAFRLHYGREPLGRVAGTCRRKWCVAGAHLQDDVLRAMDPDRLTLRGLDLLAIRTALRCDPPYPPLRIHEARMGFRIADLSVSGTELAARLSISERTFERWKAEGAPSPW